MRQKTLIAVVGPTAIGKTRLAIELAKHFKTEVVSADSRQFYKEMAIGTAVPSAEELKMAKHHFIQHQSIFEPYSVGDFEKDALLKLQELFQHNDTVILVGGSGLYVDAVVNGLDEFPDVHQEVRKQLNLLKEEKGLTYLQRELKEKDPEYYEEVDVNNPHRVIRALEVCRSSGQPYSSFLHKKKPPRFFTTIYLGISASRELIYERINKRVDIMIADGLLKEAKSLHQHKNLNALQTVGYKELFNFFDKKYALDFAIEEIKKNTRRFAKRQLTWYRKNENVIWTEFGAEPNTIISKLEKALGE